MAEVKAGLSAYGSSREIEAEFKRAAEWIRTKKGLKLPTDKKLALYGLFKQVDLNSIMCS